MSPPRPTVPASSSPPRQRGLGGIVAIVLGLLGGGGALVARLRPPKCKACGVRRVKLDEVADDAYLQAAEKMEESLGSVDYQIWVCPSCGDLRQVVRNRWFSGYSSCPGCGHRTWSTSERVVQSATTAHEGRIQVDGKCAFCDHESSWTRTIPRVRKDEDFWSSSSSPFSSSSSSSRSSSSRSSSRSYGGGHSSGGGSSGSW